MVFKSPGGVSAADLIKQAGLETARVGQATISEQNANFIVAAPGATSRDVLELIEQVRKGVAERTGVELEMSMEVW
jgi:UDP-N-acetylmuramate dehydrogenase